ncbi:uncharacterized protein LOC131207005 [Anopheles bellator]|uniref:uncharacterized protein LOC131207005 n=1 Tax=Anopheles bellator TaxID=139047 RepID=UPI002648F7B7|nr:uncharacterized protein LOC131207005 [Anopheles bellator]
MWRPMSKLVPLASCLLFCASLLPPVGSASDDAQEEELEKLAARGPLLVDNYIPVAMQVLHHCIEMIQYEPTMTPPPSSDTEVSTTTTRRPTTTTARPPTTQYPVTQAGTTESDLNTIACPVAFPTSSHKPGYYGPEKPPPPPAAPAVTTMATSSTESPKPSTESLLWSDKPFAEWFLQRKRHQIQDNGLESFKFLDPLPLAVLQAFNREPYEPLALRPVDNAQEFRRIYDDSYRGPVAIVVVEQSTKKGGKKRVPPTKPYLHMLVLYDLLKREAKKAMYNHYEGYSEAILKELSEMDFLTAKDQLSHVLTELLERKDIEKSDVVSRAKQMISDLDNRSSAIAQALEVVPPLRFGL